MYDNRINTMIVYLVILSVFCPPISLHLGACGIILSVVIIIVCAYTLAS